MNRTPNMLGMSMATQIRSYALFTPNCWGSNLPMNRPTCRQVSDCAGPLALSTLQSGRGLPQSKRFARTRPGQWEIADRPSPVRLAPIGQSRSIRWLRGRTAQAGNGAAGPFIACQRIRLSVSSSH